MHIRPTRFVVTTCLAGSFVFLANLSGANAQTVNELKSHIQLLEKRLDLLEKRLDRDSRRAPRTKKPAARSETSSYEIVNPADALEAAQYEADREERRELESKQGNQEIAGDVLAASFLFRENAPTLNSKQFEFSQNFSYLRTQRGVQSERALVSTSSLKYGIRKGMEIGLTVPFYWSSRDTQLSLTQINSNTVQDIGDIQVNLSAELWRPRVLMPGASLAFSLTVPTSSKVPYLPAASTATVPVGRDPRDPLTAYMAGQSWAVGTNIQFYNTFDPVILFGGIGAQYTFEKSVGPNTIQRGFAFNYNIGMSMALSEHTTIGVQAQGSFEDRLKVNGNFVDGTKLDEQHSMRFTLVQRLKPNVFVEPSATLGLTNNVADVIYSATWRKRF